MLSIEREGILFIVSIFGVKRNGSNTAHSLHLIR